MPQSRQLAAIVFTDIVGYTALMGEDEQKALISYRATGIAQPFRNSVIAKFIPYGYFVNSKSEKIKSIP